MKWRKGRTPMKIYSGYSCGRDDGSGPATSYEDENMLNMVYALLE